MRGLWLVVGALVIRLLLRAGGPFHWTWLSPAAPALDAAAYLCLLAALLGNRHVRGWSLLFSGLAANLLAMVANGMKMPVSLPAMQRVGIGTTTITAGEELGHQVLTASSRLPWLADIIPLSKPLFGIVISPGDVLLALGIFVVAQALLRSGPVRSPSFR